MSVKVLGIYFHFGEYLLIIAYMFSIVCQCTYCFNVGFVERLITSLWLGRLGVHSHVSDIKKSYPYPYFHGVCTEKLIETC